MSLSDGFLLYHKEGCRPADLSARFFVHVFPVNETELPEGRETYEFDNRNFSVSSFQSDGNICTVKTRLPDYAIRYIHTGQFVSVVENGAARTLNIWEADVVPPAFSVSLSDGFLLYHKEGCRRADLSARFFVHVFPVNETDLPEGRARHGYDTRNFSASSFQGGGDTCTVKTRLPDYAIRYIHTGQFVSVMENGAARTLNIWEADVVPPAFSAPAFSVSLSDGFLLYHKEGCRRADLSARFFVHVFPVNETDLPEGRARHGYDNRNFSASSFQGGGDTCTVKTRLPDYAIRHIHTGQFVGVVKNGVTHYSNLWETRIDPPLLTGSRT